MWYCWIHVEMGWSCPVPKPGSNCPNSHHIPVLGTGASHGVERATDFDDLKRWKIWPCDTSVVWLPFYVYIVLPSWNTIANIGFLLDIIGAFCMWQNAVCPTGEMWEVGKWVWHCQKTCLNLIHLCTQYSCIPPVFFVLTAGERKMVRLTPTCTAASLG